MPGSATPEETARRICAEALRLTGVDVAGVTMGQGYLLGPPAPIG